MALPQICTTQLLSLDQVIQPQFYVIPLKDLFDYTLSMDVDYWTGGFRKLDEELACYNVLETSTPSI